MNDSLNNKQWKDSVPDHLKPVGNPDADLNLHDMFHNPKVISGIIVSIIGVIVAFLSYRFLSGNARTVVAFLGGAITFIGTAQISAYINTITGNNIHQQNTPPPEE